MMLSGWRKFKQLAWEWRGVLVGVPSITVLVVLLRYAGLLTTLELKAFDLYLRLRPQQPRDERVVIVGIDEEDIKALNQGAIEDRVLVDLLKRLKAMNPRAIGLDLYRDLPIGEGYEELVEVFESTPNLIGIQKAIGDNELQLVAPSPVLQSQGQIGINDLIIDSDNVVRRALLTYPGEDDNTFYSFGLYLAALYLQAEGISPQVVPETNNWWQFNETVFVPLQTNDGGYVRADTGGYQILLNYRGSTGSFEMVKMRDILNDKVPPDWGKDRVILVGFISESFNDLYPTPYTRKTDERMPGAEIHAHIASQIISSALENRPLLKTWSEPKELIFIFLSASLGAFLVWNQRKTSKKDFFAIGTTGSLILVATTFVGGTYLAFTQSWWISIVPPLISLFGATVSITFYLAYLSRSIRHTFGRYLSSEIVSTLLEDPEGLKMGGQRRKITLLTSDLRGFTATSERLPPEEVVKILNFYLGHMADVITQYQGTIDEFMGDGILVLFGAPIERKDDTNRAIACGIAMQQVMKAVNKQMTEWDLPPLEMGIGIHTGEVVVGNIGSEKRTKYGVVGSQVNLTYRIESYTTGSQIFISDNTLQEVGDILDIRSSKQVFPKGVKEPINIYEVGGIAGEYNLYLEREEEIFVDLLEPIAIEYSIIKGKDILPQTYIGKVVKLSAREAEVSLTTVEPVALPEPLNNIKLNWLDPEFPELAEDVYAKVLEKQAKPNHFYLKFTAQPPAVQRKLSKIYQEHIARSN